MTLAESAVRYRAYISYSHRDKVWVDWLHRALERYRVPRHLVGTPGRDGGVPATPYPIFRDREELPSSADLGQQVQSALERSANLIVVCSPDAAKSRWVNEEILYYKRLGRGSRILSVIVDGEPNADGPEECFPPALKFRVGPDGHLTSERTEPIAADVRPHGDGRQNAKLKLLAGILGVDYEALRRRELEAARRRAQVFQAVAGTMVALAVAASVAAYLAARNGAEAARQRDSALVRESRFLADRSHQTLAAGDPERAMLVALEGLPVRSARPRVPETMLALEEAFGAFRGSGAVLAMPGELVQWARFSPDGKRVVTAGNHARVWDAATGAPIGVALEHGATVRSAVFSPDGKNVLTVADDGTEVSWDTASGRKRLAPMRDGAKVVTAFFSGDGRRIVTASRDGTVRVWDSGTGAMAGSPMGDTSSGPLSAALLSPDARRVLTVGRDDSRLWDASTGASIGDRMRHADDIHAASFNASGTRVLTASEDHTARLWDAMTGAPIGVPMRHDDAVMAAAFSPDGTRIVTGSKDNRARIWDAATQTAIGLPMPHDDTVFAVAFSADGSRVATASDDRTARLWEATTGAGIGAPMRHGAGVRSIMFSPDGRSLLTASIDGTARLWDAASEAPTSPPVRSRGRDELVVLSPDGTRLLVAQEDRVLRVVDPATGAPIGRPMTHPSPVRAAVFSADGRRVLTERVDGTVSTWDATTGALVGPPITSHGFTRVAFSGDGQRLAIEQPDGDVNLWDANTHRLIGQMRPGATIHSLAFSANGGRLLMTGETAVWIFDGRTAALLARARPHSDTITTAVLSADGKRVLTASRDGTARLWSADTGAPAGALMKHDDVVWSAAFSPDGKRVLTASRDGTARVWDARTGLAIGQAMRHGALTWESFARFRPDERAVLTWAMGAYSAQVWDAATGLPMGRPMVQGSLVAYAAFSADGRRVITGGDEDARLWDAATGASLAPPITLRGRPFSASFAAHDARLLIQAHGLVELWDVSRLMPPPDTRAMTAALSVYEQLGPEDLRQLFLGDSAVTGSTADRDAGVRKALAEVASAEQVEAGHGGDPAAMEVALTHWLAAEVLFGRAGVTGSPQAITARARRASLGRYFARRGAFDVLERVTASAASFASR